jgi:hypothetical protein
VLVSPSQVIVGGQTAIFTATTRFPANPIAYQWSKDCVDLKDATNATLTLTNVRRTDAGGFDVTVVDISGQPFRGLRSMLRVLVPQRFEAPTLLADGRLRLPFRDQDGDVATLSYATNYFVPQMSTNLVNWQAASGRLSLTNGFLVFEENTPLVAASRFYRIVEP